MMYVCIQYTYIVLCTYVGTTQSPIVYLNDLGDRFLVLFLKVLGVSWFSVLFGFGPGGLGRVWGCLGGVFDGLAGSWVFSVLLLPQAWPARREHPISGSRRRPLPALSSRQAGHG